jgi:hypothetical protein
MPRKCPFKTDRRSEGCVCMTVDEDMDTETAPVAKPDRPDGLVAEQSKPVPQDVLDRLVYIVGSPRSGTTIMSHSFYMSPNVLSFPGQTHFTNNVWRYRNKLDARLLRRLFRLPSFFRERNVVKAVDEATRQHLERRIHDAFATKSLAKMYQLYPLIYSLSADFPKDRSQLRCWADKAVDINGLFNIARSLPKSKQIFIIRDPRGTIASMTLQTIRTRGDESERRARRSALISSAMYWRNMMQTFLLFAKRYPSRCMFVRYEDFVENAEETINSMLAFGAGERMSAEDLNAGLSQFQFKRKHDPNAVGSGIDRQPLERWRKMLTADEITLLTAMTWRTARKLGYDIERQSVAHVMRATSQLSGRRVQAATSAKFTFLELRELTVPSRDSLVKQH